MLNWRTVTPSNSPKFLVRGTELSNAIVPNTNYRFMICEIRTWDGHDADRTYHVRDAATVNDEDIRMGIRPRMVFKSDDLHECLDYCRRNA